MSENLFWLSEAQMERLRPHLPDKVWGVARVDDRRVISGIVHVLKSGCRWVDVPAADGPRKTLYNRWRRWAEQGHWVRIFETLADAGGPPAQVLIDSSAVSAHRSASGGKRRQVAQGLGRSRGGCTTKIHALSDRWYRPVRLMVTGGNVADCTAAEPVLKRLPPDALVLIGDKGYDSSAIRDQVKSLGAFPNIPPRKTRTRRIFWCRAFYRNRNAIKRVFGRLKDFRRIATRYDRSADVSLSAVALAANVS